MAWKDRNDWGYGGWAPYVPVAERRRKAAAKIAAMAKKGEKVSPVVIKGRTIAATFWGKSWCENLEAYMDYANRLPRGRTYARNGSVIDLKMTRGKIKALVNGSSLYTVEITISPLTALRWRGVVKECSGKIDSLVELLQGKLSKGVMETVTSKAQGLFPSPREITLKCSCPDAATMCKHVAAVLYGVGNRLDDQPELLFQLRQVDHMELIASAGASTTTAKNKVRQGKILETLDLESVFGIDIDPEQTTAPGRPKVKRGKVSREPLAKKHPAKAVVKRKKVASAKGPKSGCQTKATVKGDKSVGHRKAKGKKS